MRSGGKSHINGGIGHGFSGDGHNIWGGGHGAVTTGWTPALVAERLVEALRWANAVAGAVGPKAIKSQSIGFAADVLTAEEFAEAFGGFPEVADPDEDVTPARRQYAPAKVSQMEHALTWAALYLRGHPGPSRVLKVWLRCKVFRSSFEEAAKGRRWARRTAYRARDKALSMIAVGLTRDGISSGD